MCSVEKHIIFYPSSVIILRTLQLLFTICHYSYQECGKRKLLWSHLNGCYKHNSSNLANLLTRRLLSETTRRNNCFTPTKSGQRPKNLDQFHLIAFSRAITTTTTIILIFCSYLLIFKKIGRLYNEFIHQNSFTLLASSYADMSWYFFPGSKKFHFL